MTKLSARESPGSGNVQVLQRGSARNCRSCRHHANAAQFTTSKPLLPSPECAMLHWQLVIAVYSNACWQRQQEGDQLLTLSQRSRVSGMPSQQWRTHDHKRLDRRPARSDVRCDVQRPEVRVRAADGGVESDVPHDQWRRGRGVPLRKTITAGLSIQSRTTFTTSTV